MEFNISINDNTVKVTKGESILNACRRNGISIPVLCNWPELSPTGACRLCVVELENSPDLVTACSTTVAEGMRILTHSARVIKSRKTIVSLLLANHPTDCLYCDKNGRCELQDIAYSLNIREREFSGTPASYKTDRTDPSMLMDMSKCILCGRCIRICEEIACVSALNFVERGKEMKVETVFGKGLYYSSCIHCGKCITACPTAAISEKSVINQISEKLSKTKDITITISTSTIAWFSAVNGIKKFEDTRAYLVAALRAVGFKTVNTSSFGNEIFISEHVAILNQRKINEKTPLIITDCPAVKTFIKNHIPELEIFLTNVPAPLHISGRMMKEKTTGNATNVIVAPCVSLKFDAALGASNEINNQSADFVISSMELQRLLKIYGTDIPYTKKEIADSFSVSDTSAGALFECRNGLSETILRELFFRNGNKKYPQKIFELKSEKAFVEFEFELDEIKYKIASIHGTDTLLARKDDLLRNNYVFVEVRSCTNGCISGCGNTYTNDSDHIRKMKKAISDYDDLNHTDTAGKNPFIKGLYKSTAKERLY
jgi:NADH dehydrogenase/NADH:ubiquinone oxidoreductase subunit G